MKSVTTDKKLSKILMEKDSANINDQLIDVKRSPHPKRAVNLHYLHDLDWYLRIDHQSSRKLEFYSIG